MKMWTTLIILFLIPITAAAQETVRQVKEPGEFNKFLTPGLLDDPCWQQRSQCHRLFFADSTPSYFCR